jgi:hypothetical protein
MIPDASSRSSIKLKNILADDVDSGAKSKFVAVFDALNFRLLAASPQSFLNTVCQLAKVDDPFGHFDFIRYWIPHSDYMKLKTLVEKFRFEPTTVRRALNTPPEHYDVR